MSTICKNNFSDFRYFFLRKFGETHHEVKKNQRIQTRNMFFSQLNNYVSNLFNNY